MKLSDEIQKLEKDFHLHFCRINTIDHHIQGKDLLTKQGIDRLFALLERNLHTREPIVLASLFGKYYSYLLLSGAMYCISVLNVGVNFSLQNIVMGTDDTWNPVIQLSDPEITTFSTENRNEARHRFLTLIFRDNLQVVFQQLSAQTGISMKTLWSHAAFSLQFLYRKWEKEVHHEDARQWVVEDYRYLTKEAGREIFGTIKGNPLNITFQIINHPLHEDERLTLRKTCCLRYKLPECDHCTTCPLVKEEERKALLVNYGSGKAK